MSEPRRHAVVLALAVGLLVVLYTTRPTWHWAFGAGVFAAARWLDPAVGKRAGAPRAWLVTTLVLAAVGLWLGPERRSIAGCSVSTAGAMAAFTMASRAVGLVLLGSTAAALYPASRALARLRRTRLRRFAEVLLVALELVPSLVTALTAASAASRARFPRPWQAPRRAFETFVFAVEHASALADAMARGLSAPDQAKRSPS